MKRFLLLLILSISFLQLSAQHTVAPAPTNKAVVYFVRASSLGALINFSYFDGDQLIGKFNGPKYMRYECEPGKHLFWAKAENRDFLHANLEAGKIYLIDVVPVMGAIKAGVRLFPVNSPERKIKHIKKLMTKRPPVQIDTEWLTTMQSVNEQIIERGLERYNKLNPERISNLGTYAFYPEQLKFVKKKRNQ